MNRCPRKFLAVLTLACLAASRPAPVRAEEAKPGATGTGNAKPAVHLRTPNLPATGLALSGLVGDGQTTLSALLEVEADGAEGPLPLRLEARDLAGTDDRGEARKLPAENVTIPQGAAVAPGRATTVRLMVAGLKEAARYDGRARLVAGSGKDEVAVALDLHVVAETRPRLEETRSPFTMRIARCGAWDCWLARRGGLLVPGAPWVLQLTNKGDGAARVEALGFRLVGERTGRTMGGSIGYLTAGSPRPSGDAKPKVDAAALQVIPASVPASTGCAAPAVQPDRAIGEALAPGEAVTIPICVSAGELASDRYAGEIVVRARGTGPSTPQATTFVKAEVAVRDGPLWAVLVVLLGIVIGRAARGFDTPAAQAQVRLYGALQRARGEIGDLRDDDVKASLRAALASLERAIDRGDPESELQKKLDARRHLAVDVWRRVEEWQRKLSALGVQSALTEAKADAVRLAIKGAKGEDVAAADAAMAEFEAAALEAQTRGVRARAAAAAPMLADASEPPAREEARTPPKEPGRLLTSLRDWLGALSGYSPPTARTRWVIAQAMFLLLLLLLTVIGVQTLYFDAPAFGAGGFADYVGLLLWGIGADIAQRTLQNLPALPK